MPNITTNHAIIYTNSLITKKKQKELSETVEKENKHDRQFSSRRWNSRQLSENILDQYLLSLREMCAFDRNPSWTVNSR